MRYIDWLFEFKWFAIVMFIGTLAILMLMALYSVTHRAWYLFPLLVVQAVVVMYALEALFAARK